MDSQDQGLSYTNLLCGNSIVSLDDSPPLPTNPNSVKKSKRGVNFTAKEDELVVAAWLNHSLDSIQGTDQKYSQLWENIYLYFEQHKETTNERSIKSLSNRWSSIQKATNTFCSCLDQVERLNISGITDHDKFEKAKFMYHKQEECNFAFEHCWNLLKDQPKWILRDAKGESKKKRMTVPSQTPTTTPSEAGNAIEMKLSNWIDHWVGKLQNDHEKLKVSKPRKSNNSER
ncbi:glutathione S-transferase T3-like [Bidens hawaiensis]|uniref:glutathione S-transferase T3-like n=1 Tax=Bidens hawaiensis TaxID=980011 RepID=UPI00404B777F